MIAPTVIPQDLIFAFIEQKNLKGIVSFLVFLKHQKNLKDFYSFCEYNNVFIKNQAKLPKAILFHGSQVKLRDLKPNASIDQHGKAEEQELIYATDDPNYAIFLATLNLKSGSAGVDYINKKIFLTIDLEFVNGPSKLKNAYVHIIPATHFKKIKIGEYSKREAEEILFTIMVSPTDLSVPINIVLNSTLSKLGSKESKTHIPNN